MTKTVQITNRHKNK